MVGLAFYFIVINYFMNTISRFYSNIIKAQSLFKDIFDNSEESVIILSDDKIEYVNDIFLQNFHKLFKNVKRNHSSYNTSGSETVEPPSKQLLG